MNGCRIKGGSLTLRAGTGAEDTKTAKMTKSKVNLTRCMFPIEKVVIDLEKNSKFEKRLSWTSQ